MRTATIQRPRQWTATRPAAASIRPARGTDRSALFVVGRYLAYAAVATSLLLLLPWLARTGGSQAFGEDGPIEWIQWGEIVVAAVLFFGGAIRFPERRELLVSLGILATVAVIREQNNTLATALPGIGWSPVAAAIVLIGLVWLWGRRVELVEQLGEFVFTAPFALLAAGLFVVVVFAQLVCAREIWQSLLDDGFRRQVTRAIQENVEVLGYSLLMMGAIETLLYRRPAAAKLVDDEEQMSFT